LPIVGRTSQKWGGCQHSGADDTDVGRTSNSAPELQIRLPLTFPAPHVRPGVDGY